MGRESILSNKLEANEFGLLVADILGQVWRGIYHLPCNLSKVHWNRGWVEINLTEGMATFDSAKLTELIVLCYDNMIRLEIVPCHIRILKLYFHKRKTRTGSLCERLPELEDHIKDIREGLSLKEFIK